MIENILKAAGCGGWVKFFQTACIALHCVGREACVGWNDLRLGNREKSYVRHSRIFCFENLPQFF
jgi:hypothetical protein